MKHRTSKDLEQKFYEIIKEKSGVVISGVYKNRKSVFKIKCKNNFIFMSDANRIVYRGYWCFHCSGMVKLTLEDAKYEANKRGGECLSTEYINCNEDLDFRCKRFHNFSKPLTEIRNQNQWCPYCKISSEEICRYYFEQLFDNKFPRIRPDFLKNEKTGRNLELDGFCESLNLAFEHQGDQHYNNNYLYKNSNKITFDEVVKRDKFKKIKCKENNISLIVIPELNTMTKIEKLKDFIKQECINLAVNIPKEFDNISIDLLKYNNDEKLEKCKNIIIKNGGRYVEGNYITRKSFITYYCKHNHLNIKSCDSILRELWCKKCVPEIISEKKRNNIDFYLNIVRSKDGEVISHEEYKNNSCIVISRCPKSHIFKKTCRKLQNGEWCKECSREALATKMIKGIGFYENIIKSKNGKIISHEEYKNNTCKITSECEGGHMFVRTCNEIQCGRWCQTCNKIARKSKS